MQTLCFEASADKLTHNLRSAWLSALLAQDMEYFDKTKVGDLPSLIQETCSSYRRAVGLKMGQGIQFSTMAIGGIGVAFYFTWQVTLVSLACIPMLAASGFWLVKVNQTAKKASVEDYSKAGNVAYVTLTNLKTILSLDAAGHFVGEYEEKTEKAKKVGVKRGFNAGLANGCLFGSFIAMYLVLTLYGAYLIYEEMTTGSSCSPANTNVSEYASPCKISAQKVFSALLGVAFAGQGAGQIGTWLEALGNATEAIKPAIDVIDKEKGIDVNLRTSVVAKVKKGFEIDTSSSDEGGKGVVRVPTIEFVNVTFSYPSRPSVKVLDNFSLSVEPGKTVAFVGPSGCGKSTIVQLLARFYDPDAGVILFDGVNIKKMNVSELRKAVSLISQEPVLFNTTITENIANGACGIGVSEEEIKTSAKAANAHDFISAFPAQYNTNCGEGGGGEN